MYVCMYVIECFDINQMFVIEYSDIEKIDQKLVLVTHCWSDKRDPVEIIVVGVVLAIKAMTLPGIVDWGCFCRGIWSRHKPRRPRNSSKEEKKIMFVKVQKLYSSCRNEEGIVNAKKFKILQSLSSKE